MNRLTPESVRELFAEVGATPIQGRWDNQDGTACCVLGALSKRYGQRSVSLYDIAEKRGTSYDYLLGVLCGWDGQRDTSDLLTPGRRHEWSLGYADGKAAWEAMGA